MALKSKALNTALTIMFIAFPVHGAVVKRSTGARYSIPGKGRLFSGCMGIEFRLMNVSEWGFNYELHFQNNGNNERIQQQKVVY
jgi:hypothetical protein